MHSFEQMVHGCASTPSQERGFQASEQKLADVFVSKPARDAVAG
jgi:hypothetical protein